jgi:uncharacterized protein (DUF2267 family)
VDGPAARPTDSWVTAHRSWPSGVLRRRDEHRRYERSFDAAFEHTRAVFATLAEALPPGELRDILDELPRVYRDTLY